MMRSVLMMLIAAVLTIPLTACKTMATSGGTEVCAVWRGIGWSEKDTPQTIDDVKGNNTRRKAWCR